MNQLEKENNMLKIWKGKVLNWLRRYLDKSKMLAFIQHVGGIQKRSKQEE